MRGLIRSSSSSNNSLAICIAKDNQMFPLPIDTSETAFVLSLPENYPLNSTTHPRIVVNVQCHIANNTNVNQVGVISNEMNENDARSFSLSLSRCAGLGHCYRCFTGSTHHPNQLQSNSTILCNNK